MELDLKTSNSICMFFFPYFTNVYSWFKPHSSWCVAMEGNETVNLISTSWHGVENMVKGYI